FFENGQAAFGHGRKDKASEDAKSLSSSHRFEMGTFLRMRRHASQLHVFQHALTKRGHEMLLSVKARSRTPYHGATDQPRCQATVRLTMLLQFTGEQMSNGKRGPARDTHKVK